MKVLVLVPPSPYTKNVLRDSIYGCWCKGKRIGGATTPPHPLVLIATVLDKTGVPARVVDTPVLGWDMDDLRREVREFDVIVTNSSVMTFNEDAEVVRLLKEAHPRLVWIVAGAQPTFMPEFCLKNESVDVIVRREPEFIVRDVVMGLARGDESWKEVKGIGYRESGRPVQTPEYPLIQDLDEIPLADWSLLHEHKKLRYFNPAVKRFPYVTDLTTRGCFARCTFCMAPGFYGGKVRGRSAENVLEGFRRHIAEGYREIYLRDELFSAMPKRNIQICEQMVAEKMDLTWICSARVGLDRRILRLMKQAGCHLIKMGVESGDQAILDRIKKGITLEEVEETFSLCRELGIHTHAHFMVGHPGETKETIRKTVEFAKKIRPSTATFGMLTPYPGTPIFEEVAEMHPGIRENFSLNLKMLHSTSFYTDALCKLTSEELAGAVKQVHREFYLRPSYIWDRLSSIRSFGEFSRTVKAGLKVTDFALRGDD